MPWDVEDVSRAAGPAKAGTRSRLRIPPRLRSEGSTAKGRERSERAARPLLRGNAFSSRPASLSVDRPDCPRDELDLQAHYRIRVFLNPDLHGVT